jgi:hypothetical protein
MAPKAQVRETTEKKKKKKIIFIKIEEFCLSRTFQRHLNDKLQNGKNIFKLQCICQV